MPDPIGTVRDVVGRRLGVGGTTYVKAKQVVEAAEEDPDKYGDLSGFAHTICRPTGRS